MTSKHTPGPWLAYDWHSPARWAVQADRQRGSANIGRKIADITNPAGQDAGEEEASNARLMAAAPDLLAALRLAAIWTEALPSDSSEKIAADNAVRAAIRKATE